MMNIQETLENYNSMKARISILQAEIEKINNEAVKKATNEMVYLKQQDSLNHL